MHTALVQPDNVGTHAPLRVLVVMHGTGGHGEQELQRILPLAKQTFTGPWLIVAPTFDTPYQYLLPDADRRLLDEVTKLQTQHPALDPTLHLYGFSGGAQFAHRFALRHPTRVAACAAFAAGCWTDPDGTAHGMQIDEGWFTRDGWNDPAILAMARTGTTDADALRRVRFLVGCGTLDHDSRQRSAHDFHQRLQRFGVDATWRDWVGDHGGTPDDVTRDWLRFVDHP